MQKIHYITLREGLAPTSEQQWFYRKEEDDGSFVIISVNQGKVQLQLDNKFQDHQGMLATEISSVSC